MRKLFLDTNIILDLLAKREPNYQPAAIIFSMADRNELQLYASSLTFATTHYILEKITGSLPARMHLKKLRSILNLLNVDEKVVDLALSDIDFKDLEDAIQYYTAIEGKQDIIITRDGIGFRESSIPVMTCKEFIFSVTQ